MPGSEAARRPTWVAAVAAFARAVQQARRGVGAEAAVREHTHAAMHACTVGHRWEEALRVYGAVYAGGLEPPPECSLRAIELLGVAGRRTAMGIRFSAAMTHGPDSPVANARVPDESVHECLLRDVKAAATRAEALDALRHMEQSPLLRTKTTTADLDRLYGIIAATAIDAGGADNAAAQLSALAPIASGQLYPVLVAREVGAELAALSGTTADSIVGYGTAAWRLKAHRDVGGQALVGLRRRSVLFADPVAIGEAFASLVHASRHYDVLAVTHTALAAMLALAKKPGPRRAEMLKRLQLLLSFKANVRVVGFADELAVRVGMENGLLLDPYCPEDVVAAVARESLTRGTRIADVHTKSAATRRACHKAVVTAVPTAAQ